MGTEPGFMPTFILLKASRGDQTRSARETVWGAGVWEVADRLEPGVDISGWGKGGSSRAQTPFAAQPDSCEVLALWGHRVLGEATGHTLHGKGPFPPRLQACYSASPTLLCFLSRPCSSWPPTQPPATSAVITGHIQGHLTFGKSKDKGWAPQPSPGPPTPRPSRQRPPEAPDLLEVTEFTAARPSQEQRSSRPGTPCQVTKTLLYIFQTEEEEFQVFPP